MENKSISRLELIAEKIVPGYKRYKESEKKIVTQTKNVFSLSEGIENIINNHPYEEIRDVASEKYEKIKDVAFYTPIFTIYTGLIKISTIPLISLSAYMGFFDGLSNGPYKTNLENLSYALPEALVAGIVTAFVTSYIPFSIAAKENAKFSKELSSKYNELNSFYSLHKEKIKQIPDDMLEKTNPARMMFSK